MGFPSYFERDFIALNKRLTAESGITFKNTIEQNIICLEFDSTIEKEFGAEICIELLIRILSRFYPKLKFTAQDEAMSGRLIELKKIARAINSNIEFVTSEAVPTAVICIGKASSYPMDIPHFFVGGDEWTAKISSTGPLLFSSLGNPFGPAVAACLVCAEVFKLVFSVQLQSTRVHDIEFSVANFLGVKPYRLSSMTLDDVNLVGVGAIGSASVWILSKIKELQGKITLIDHDKIEASNLQRYVLFQESDIGQLKVNIASRALQSNNLSVNPVSVTWEKFVSENHAGECKVRLAAVAIDSKEGRIRIQSSLPRKIINAYTDESRFGISRHPNFREKVCLACIYMPETVQKSRLDIMCDELNMKGYEPLLYQYMKDGKLLDETILKVFSSRNNIQLSDVEDFKGRPLSDFYLEMVCGYKMIKIKGSDNRAADIDVPLSFQSAIGGIMLAAEIIVEASGVPKMSDSDVSQWQILEDLSINNPSHLWYLKNASKVCLCGDKDYTTTYEKKWHLKAQP